MTKIIVLDTCAVISYFSEIFKEPPTISTRSLRLVDKAFEYGEMRMIVPSIVFIEIYQNYCTSQEWSQKLTYEVLLPIKNAENFEIRAFDRDALARFVTISDIEPEARFDNHDKQILSVAMDMMCPLMTSDSRIIRYNQRKAVIPQIFN